MKNKLVYRLPVSNDFQFFGAPGCMMRIED